VRAQTAGSAVPGIWVFTAALALDIVNERPATPRLGRQGVTAEPVGQATRAEPAGSGFGDVLGIAAVATEGHG